MKQINILFTGLLFVAAFTNSSNASVNLVLSGTPGSSIINYSLSGSGSFNFGTGHSSAHANDIGFDAFGPIFTDDAFAVTGTGSITNETQAVTVALTEIRLDNDDTFFDKDDLTLFFGFVGVPHIEGDLYSLSGSGTFDVTSVGATFDDFNQGSDIGPISGLPLTGNFNLTVAPEPSRAMLLLAGFVGLIIQRRRSSSASAG